MRVALLTLEGGGISSVCHGLASSLSKKGISTTIFTETPHDRLEREQLSAHLDVVRFPMLSLPPKPLWFQIRNFRKLSKLLEDYTIVHGVSPDASFFRTFNKNKLNKPFIASIHSAPLSSAKTYLNVPTTHWSGTNFAFHILEFPLHDFVARRCLFKSDHVVLCSFAVLDELRTRYTKLESDKVSVIYNGLDFDHIENVKIDDNAGKDGFSIVFAARLFWLKGASYLLKAFEIVKREFKDVRLEIFGKGPEGQRITRFVEERGLQDSVHLHGHIPHKNLIAEIKKSDLVAFPSLYEGQPMTVLEAMACKKPVVMFDYPFAREIIKDGHNGLLARPLDEKDFSDKIRLLLSDKNLRSELGHNAYEYVREEHNWDIQVDKYLEVYRKATKETDS